MADGARMICIHSWGSAEAIVAALWQHPEGLVDNHYGEARVYFEYGSHVDGCRIHVTEIKTHDPAWKDDDAEPSTMPGSWDFDGD